MSNRGRTPQPPSQPSARLQDLLNQYRPNPVGEFNRAGPERRSLTSDFRTKSGAEARRSESLRTSQAGAVPMPVRNNPVSPDLDTKIDEIAFHLLRLEEGTRAGGGLDPYCPTLDTSQDVTLQPPQPLVRRGPGRMSTGRPPVVIPSVARPRTHSDADCGTLPPELPVRRTDGWPKAGEHVLPSTPLTALLQVPVWDKFVQGALRLFASS